MYKTKDQLFWLAAKAVIVRDGKVLMLMNERHAEPYWDFPGGRLRSDENVNDALSREVSEELPDTGPLEVAEILLAERVREHSDDEYGLFMVFYRTNTTVPDEITTPEHTGHQFFTKNEVSALSPIRDTYRQAALAALGEAAS